MNEKRQDIRWIQRLSNYTKALSQLSKFFERKELNDLEEQGLIKAFEYTFELAWNVIKDFYQDQGETQIQGSRDAFRLAIKRGLITHGDDWMDMIEDRKLTVHTYNEETVDEIGKNINNRYFRLFLELEKKLEEHRSGRQGEIQLE